jgi:hypothetical protein
LCRNADKKRDYCAQQQEFFFHVSELEREVRQLITEIKIELEMYQG